MELGCYEYISENNLEFKLSNVLNFLSNRQKSLWPEDINKQKLFVFNISCQGFNSNNVCENTKCLSKLRINTSDIIYTKIFNQSSFQKIVEVLKLLEMPNYQNIGIDEEDKSNLKIMTKILESTKFFLDSENKNHTETACKLLIWYFKQEYKKIYKQLFIKIFS
jgi:hypothetical protein